VHPHPALQYQSEVSGSVVATALVDLPLGRILATNLAFALYHPIVAGAASATMNSFLGLDPVNKSGVRQVFRDPTFLFLAFILGNTCSVAYWMAGGALYAPVLVHGVAVAIWLDLLGGEEALRGKKGD